MLAVGRARSRGGKLTQTYKPEGDCYARVADAACEARDREGAARYCEEAKKRGRMPSEAACAFAEGQGRVGGGAGMDSADVDEDDTMALLPTTAGILLLP